MIPDAAPIVFNAYQVLASYGIAGLIIAIIVVPMIRWIMSELTAQRAAFMNHIDTHEKQEIEILSQIKPMLQALLSMPHKEA